MLWGDPDSESRLYLLVFMEVQPTYHEMNHFKVNSSVVFSTFAMLCNHHLCLVPEHAITPKGDPVPMSRNPPSLSSSPWHPRACSLSLYGLGCSGCCTP